MNLQTLQKILVEELGAKASDGDEFEVPSERKVTILVRFGDDTLRVARVQAMRATEDFVNLVGETEQFFVDPDSDFAIKSEDSAKRREARPGFH
jgi:hypothetical protein